MSSRKRRKSDIETEELKPTCSICLQQFSNRTFLRPCYHSFCFYCIKSWINVSNSACPVCRQTITSLVYNIDDEENTFDEYSLKDKGNSKYHDPPLYKRKYTSPEERIRIERSNVYKGVLKPSSYPEPLPRHENFTVITPEYIPRTRIFLQHELKIILGENTFDSFIEDHFIQILSVPFTTKSTTMYDATTIQKLSEWLDDDKALATTLLNELIAFLKSGLAYKHFISAAMYIHV